MDEPAETLECNAVVLRRWRSTEADVVYRMVDESLEHLRPWMPWVAEHSRERSAEFAARCEEKWASGSAYTYAITFDATPVGSCGLVRRIGVGGLEIGYWLHPGYTGRGLATSAAAALTVQGFELSGVDRIEIIHDEANPASGAVPKRLGFTHVETRPATVPRAPSDTGLDVVWRMEHPEFLQRRW
ncbi:GNAT family N-acetyltransferase [Streptomyces sp. NBC_01381]|uniref:GNAT family N-acetyltransferase n=1 Tax=Streptomyces sp. NBC_01381 TaxID=2903845 RepID=UPI00225555FD|nr:GNAT family N-acetyltransferase [Streptomyces sp. NBC_01381]MCX4666500.1 GNAT family N-acetyltransferase [Streptomyces sp. NBC_01381]